MGDRLILAIDCGTQSVRGLLFDDCGHLVTKQKVETRALFLTGTWICRARGRRLLT